MHRHELTDEEFELLKPLLPSAGRRGGQWRDHHQVLNGLFWRLRTGAPWRDIPERYGPWKTIYHRFNQWRKDGTFDKMIQALQVRLDRNGLIEWDLWCIDSSSIRATRAAAGAGKKGAMPSRKTMAWAAPKAATPARSTW